jgi:hypothetical protein
MFINKIIYSTQLIELNRKTHLKIIFNNDNKIYKLNPDIKNKNFFININMEINDISDVKIEIGEYKNFIELYFLKNFNINENYFFKDNILYINDN